MSAITSNQLVFNGFNPKNHKTKFLGVIYDSFILTPMDLICFYILKVK